MPKKDGIENIWCDLNLRMQIVPRKEMLKLLMNSVGKKFLKTYLNYFFNGGI